MRMLEDRRDGRRRMHREAFARYELARALRADGCSLVEIARRMGVHPVTVWSWFDRYDGLERPLA